MGVEDGTMGVMTSLEVLEGVCGWRSWTGWEDRRRRREGDAGGGLIWPAGLCTSKILSCGASFVCWSEGFEV